MTEAAPISTQRPLGGFVVRVIAWLPAAFFVWYFAAPVLTWPAAFIVELVARAGFGDIVRGIAQSGSTLTFATALQPGESGAKAGQITVGVNMLLYAYGLPLYAALVLAAREPHWGRRLAYGYAALTPFVAWGVLADFLKNVAISAGPLVASQTGFVAWQREAIAFAYQMGSLILPTVAPAVAWVVSHQAFLERLRRVVV
ncbi:MAG: exosortase H-associated membrane protein [Betaproteobacteria bacterium]